MDLELKVPKLHGSSGHDHAVHLLACVRRKLLAPHPLETTLFPNDSSVPCKILVLKKLQTSMLQRDIGLGFRV